MLPLSPVANGQVNHTGRDSNGVTLIELVIVVAVMGIVLSGITALLLVTTDATKRAQEQLNESGGLRIASVYFNPDVQSADEFVTGTASCVQAAGDASDLVVELRGDDVVGADPESTRRTTASYVLTDGGATLTRYACEGSSVTDAVVVAEGLDPLEPPVVECYDKADASIGCENAQAAKVTLVTTSDSTGQTHRMTAARRTA